MSDPQPPARATAEDIEQQLKDCAFVMAFLTHKSKTCKRMKESVFYADAVNMISAYAQGVRALPAAESESATFSRVRALVEHWRKIARARAQIDNGARRTFLQCANAVAAALDGKEP